MTELDKVNNEMIDYECNSLYAGLPPIETPTMELKTYVIKQKIETQYNEDIKNAKKKCEDDFLLAKKEITKEYKRKLNELYGAISRGADI